MNNTRNDVYVSKWVTFAASAFIQACAGLSYSFSIYAPAIKDKLNLSQTQLAYVGSSVNLGGYFAILAGSIYDALKEHHKFGPRLVIWLGSLCCFCGYFGLYLLASGKAPGDFYQLLLFATCAGNAGTWYDTSALVTNVRNFPNDRGFVVGVLKSFLGLSASIYTSIYIATFESDAVTFLLLLSILPTGVCLVLSLLVNYVPFVECSETLHKGSWFSTEGRFLLSYFLVAGIAFYQMACAVVVGHEHLDPTSRKAIMAGMLGLLSLMVFVPYKTGSFKALYAHDYIGSAEADNSGSLGDQATESAEAATTLPPRGQGAATASRSGRITVSTHSPRAAGVATEIAHAPRPGTALRQQVLTGRQRAASHHHHTPDAAAACDSPTYRGNGQSNGLQPGSHWRTGSANAALDNDSSNSAADHESTPLLLAGPNSPLLPGDAISVPRSSPPELTTGEMLLCIDFWMYFLQFCVGTGVCLAYLNNLGQLVIALGGQHDGQVVFVSLFSVANAAGRLTMGYIPENYLHSTGTPRTIFLSFIALLMAAVALLTAYARLNHLYVISIMLGFVFGAHWSLLPAITSDVFGLKHFAANYTTLQIAPALGSLLLASRLTGWLYDEAAKRHGDVHVCIGQDCFQKAFMILSGLAAVSSLASLIATARSRVVYRVIHEHLHHVDEAEGHVTP